MLRVIDCLTLHHDHSVLALAVLVCALGCVSGAIVARRAMAAERAAFWTLLLVLCVGATAWSTHFISMLAYHSNVPITFAADRTVLSLLAGLALVGAGFACAVRWRRRRSMRWCGGALVGTGVLALHYIGMSGMRFPGTLTYAPDLVLGSIVAGAVLGMASLGFMLGPRRRRHRPLGAVLLSLTILSVHFLGMGSAEVALGFADADPGNGWQRGPLAIGVALVSLAVLAIGITAALVDQRVAARLAYFAYLAGHDPLTDLPNRRHFRELADEAFARARRTGRRFAVFTIDLDDFKSINDVHGHAAGDEYIRIIGRRLAGVLDEGDLVARLGGDEFALLQLWRDDTGHREAAERLAAAVHGAFATPIAIDDAQLSANGSIGIALYPDDGDDIDVLLRNADMAMYHAKANGKGIDRFFDASMNAELEARRRLETRLRLALADGHLRLAYQPLVNGDDRSPVCFEALLRWDDEELGRVDPEEFMPVAESTGLIVPIGELVLERACRDAATWPDPLRVAVNLSAVQFVRGGPVDAVRAALEASGLPGRRLELEIAETLLLDDQARNLATLAELHALGVRIVMDGFGSGCSSLGCLRSFEFAKLKVDPSFVSRIDTCERDAVTVRTVIAMGRSLGIRIGAAGVDTDAQVDFLKGLGCDELQGELIGRPMPAEAVVPFLRETATRPGDGGGAVRLIERRDVGGAPGGTPNRKAA